MEPGLFLGDIRVVIRRALGLILAAGGVVALGWGACALLVALLVGQNWDAGAILTVVGMALGGLAILGLAWQVSPHRARLRWPTRCLRNEDSPSPSPPSPVPPLPTSRWPKFSE
jgi:hypothetical protein